MEVKEDKPLEFYDRYSRQYYVMGGRAMSNMEKANIFISGMGGLGVEIAKCVTLSGVNRVTLHDTVVASSSDLSSQYYLVNSVGKNRATATADMISSLNPYVSVDTSQVDLNENLEFLKEYWCVVLTQTPLHLQIKINEFCRKHGVRFISAESRGLFCWGFVDFGEKFEVFDSNGEFPRELFITDVSREKQAVVTCTERHGLDEGSYIQFAEVQGMEEVNSLPPQAIKLEAGLLPEQFRIDLDTSSFNAFRDSGRIIESKQSQFHSFKSLAESLEEPEFLATDFGKLDRPPQLHIAMQALHKFQLKYNALPKPWDSADAKALKEIAVEVNAGTKAKVDKLDEKLIETLSFTAAGEIIALTGVLGGHFAQEVLKAVSGKFTPLKQWLYLDATELVGDGGPEDHAVEGSRYDSQIICIGRKTTARLRDTKLFMVGAGAIGCEMIKNYAMLGVSTGPNGKIVLTDNDVIEKSNLNRQFLFRDKDINTAKSTTAAASALLMNPDVKIEAFLDKVGPDTEEKYSNNFFKNVDYCVNALDNVAARKYMDQRIVQNHKPLLESGTMGTKGHVQVIVPHRTECYSDLQDEKEVTEYAVCTIKTFPEKIEHTIEWARVKFQTLFLNKPRELEKFIENPSVFLQKLPTSRTPLSNLQYIRNFLKNPLQQFEDCVSYARRKFENYYHNATLQLLHKFPKDHVVDGKPFWKLPRRPPAPIKFDPNNEVHFQFVMHTALIVAYLYNIPVDTSVWTKDKIRECVSAIVVNPFELKAKEYITDTKVKKVEEKVIDPETYNNIAKELATLPVPKNLTVRVRPFEKDDDTNSHVDFITACSNIRAISYGIHEATRMESKRIAGRIVPAISTTTATVAGLVSIELIKITMNLIKEIPYEYFRCTTLNLALPMYAMAEPGPAKKIPITGEAFYTIWHSWSIHEPEYTLQQFCDYFEKNLKLQVGGVFQGNKRIYAGFFPADKKKLPKKMKELLTNTTGEFVELNVCFDDENGNQVDAPTVRFYLH
eukprot:TRINITY_DN5354_c0_g1_i1.p1 TRINITY_DN5354_c0_g1~~TRINITY_DN5354_c0_g1_i1.p1  ORF type:complete len:1006 (+),score=246.06 TRINITY_DN5354_c0_g1_i1:32-3049(+)